jgi:hypothetical protein
VGSKDNAYLHQGNKDGVKYRCRIAGAGISASRFNSWRRISGKNKCACWGMVRDPRASGKTANGRQQDGIALCGVDLEHRRHRVGQGGTGLRTRAGASVSPPAGSGAIAYRLGL